MYSNVYVNNNDLVENYFVRIDEKKMEFVESLLDFIQLKKINDEEIKKIDLTVEQKESLLKKIIHVIKRKTTNTPFIIVALDDYEKAVDKKFILWIV